MNLPPLPPLPKPPTKVLIFAPQPNSTADEVMQVLKLVMFQSYPIEHRTIEQLEALYNKLPGEAQRHFRWKELNK